MISRRTFLAASSLAFPFVSRGAAKPILQLGLLADPQYLDAPAAGTRFYRQSIGKLGAAVEHFNTLDLDFCVNAGDTIDRDLASFDAILKPLAQCRHKFHHILGNHDFELPDDQKGGVPARLGLTRRYHSITQSGFCFLMLDTNDVSLYAQPASAPETRVALQALNRLAATRVIHAQPWNGAVGPAQLDWLDETCRKAAAEKQKVIIFSHHPVLPSPHNRNAWNSDALASRGALHPNIVAWISGHNHAGAYELRGGLPFITLKGMVETQDTNAFATARLFADRLELTGHGREISREIPFRGS